MGLHFGCKELLGQSWKCFIASQFRAATVKVIVVPSSSCPHNDIPPADPKPTRTVRDLPEPKSFDEIPGPKGNRHLYLLKHFAPVFGKFQPQQRLDYDRLLHVQYGPLVRVPRIGRQPYALYVYDPKAYADIYKLEGRFPFRNPFASLWKIIQDSRGTLEAGLTTLNNEEWFTKRREMQPKMMHLGRLDPYVPSMEAISENYIQMLEEMIEDGDNVHLPNIRPFVQQWALESLMKAVFNVKTSKSSEDRKDYQAVIKTIEDVMSGLDDTQTALMLWKYLPNRHFNRLKRAFNELGRWTVKYANKGIAETRGEKQSEPMPLFLEILERYENEPKKLVGYFAEVLMAGLHTTSGTIEMVLYFLSQNPDAQSKLYAEIVSLLPDKSARMTPELLKQFRYVKACIKETLRFAPALSLQVRSFDKDITLCDYRIPARTLIYMMFGVSSTSDTYFRDASQFFPDRWLAEGPGASELRGDPFASLPFGHGPRMCIGKRISELEMNLFIIKMIQNFVILPGHKVELRTNILYYADPPVGITLQKRNK